MTVRFGKPRPRIPLCVGDRQVIADATGLHPNTVSGVVNGSRCLGLDAAERFLEQPQVARSTLALEHLRGRPINPAIRIFSFETDQDIEHRIARAIAAGVDVHNPRAEREQAA